MGDILPLFPEQSEKASAAESRNRSEPRIYKYLRAMNHEARRDFGEEVVTMQFIGELALQCEDQMFEMCKLRAKAEEQELAESDMEKAKELQEIIGAYRTILEFREQHEILIVAEETAREHAMNAMAPPENI